LTLMSLWGKLQGICCAVTTLWLGGRGWDTGKGLGRVHSDAPRAHLGMSHQCSGLWFLTGRIKMSLLKKSISAAALVLALNPHASAATLTTANGIVQANVGGGFKPAAVSMKLKAGDSVMAGTNSTGVITYDSGCSVSVSPGQVVAVTEEAACKLSALQTGATGPASGAAGTSAGGAAAGGAGAGAGAAAAGLTAGELGVVALAVGGGAAAIGIASKKSSSSP
jgi:hypothetical protein